ncbi:Mitochondrial amidoxime-reducing component 1 [Grifola frondosa]|uniref:Mitochondrial amidoxime-reducing component 1 n=1 Tax=Grifola frondosa TaxID=5627 RepID=A0A1C7LUX7_GRIFR|nr:Mitochondrial amidoxime-reducing component 1 [Grifola frondosa]
MAIDLPRLVPDSSSPHGGELVVTFPEGSGCETFLVPLDPAPDVLRSWKVLQDCTLFGQILDGYICDPISRASPSPTAMLSKYFARPVHLVMKGPEPRACPPTLGVPDLKATAVFQDGYPFLVVSEESLEQVRRLVSLAAHKSQDDDGRIGGLDQRRWVDGDVEMERFRPNIVLKGSGLPFAEDTWREIVIAPELESNPKSASSTKTFTLVSKCARCLLPNVDPATGTRDAAVPYKVLMKFRTGKDPARQSKPCFGCNAVVGGKGIIRVGDWITVKEWAGVGGV